jgi:hypothetical protein
MGIILKLVNLVNYDSVRIGISQTKSLILGTEELQKWLRFHGGNMGQKTVIVVELLSWEPSHGRNKIIHCR